MEEELAAIRRWEGTVRALVDWDPLGARQRRERSGRGPLSGWSLGVKDIIDVQGMPTRCNVDFLPETPAREHAAIVGRLLSLGAFVLSKTVTTTFAFLDPGATRNPWNPATLPAVPAAVRPRPWPAGWFGWRWVPRRWLRSIVRPATAGSRGSSPPSDVYRPPGSFPSHPAWIPWVFLPAAFPTCNGPPRLFWESPRPGNPDISEDRTGAGPVDRACRGRHVEGAVGGRGPFGCRGMRGRRR